MSLRTSTCASVLLSHADSLVSSHNSLLSLASPAVAIIACYAPQVLHRLYEAPVSRYPARSPSSGPAISCKRLVCSALASGAARGLSLTKLMSSIRSVSSEWLVSFSMYSSSRLFPPQLCLDSRLTGSADGRGGRESAWTRG